MSRKVTAMLIGVLGVSLAAHAEPFAYVTNRDSNTVSVIDTATNAVSVTVNVGDGSFRRRDHARRRLRLRRAF
jgi:YVTN family beta-propeller protein